MGEKVYKPIVKDGDHLIRSKDNPDRVRGLMRDENNQNRDTVIPERSVFGHMKDIAFPDAPEDIYISATGCVGIVRRSCERKTSINERLKEVLLSISYE